MAPLGVAQGRGRGSSKRRVKSENVKCPEVEATTYDSDSYENHVIDLRGSNHTNNILFPDDAHSFLKIDVWLHLFSPVVWLSKTVLNA